MLDTYALKQYILLTRPYSVIDVGVLGLLALVFSNVETTYLNGISAFILSILLWVGFNWLNESIQKDKGRINIPLYVPVIVFTITTIWYFSVYGFNIIYIFLLMSFLIYAHKHKYPLLTRYIFFLRGVNVILLFLLFTDHNFSSEILIIICLLFFTQSFRSFIGDFRDIKYDEYTFMKKHTIKTSKLFLFLLGVFAVIFGFGLNAILGFIVLLYILYFTLKYLGMEENNLTIGVKSYKLHQHSIIFTLLIKVILLLQYNNEFAIANLLIISLLLALMVLLSKSYGKVIRPINFNKDVSSDDAFI